MCSQGRGWPDCTEQAAHAHMIGGQLLFQGAWAKAKCCAATCDWKPCQHQYCTPLGGALTH